MPLSSGICDEYHIPYHWSLQGFYRYLHELKFSYCAEFFSLNDRVLDCGGGDGKIAALAAPRVREVIVTDVNPRALAFGRMLTEGIPNIRFQETAGVLLPFSDAAFDKALMIEVIEHISPHEAAPFIQEVARVLKPGGTLFLTTPNRRDLRSRIWGERAVTIKHPHEYTVAELTKLLESNFSVREIRGIYLTPPIPLIEHFANIVPLRGVFRWFARAGKTLPHISQNVWIAATRRA